MPAANPNPEHSPHVEALMVVARRAAILADFCRDAGRHDRANAAFDIALVALRAKHTNPEAES